MWINTMQQMQRKSHKSENYSLKSHPKQIMLERDMRGEELTKQKMQSMNKITQIPLSLSLNSEKQLLFWRERREEMTNGGGQLITPR
jgi:hypothetical protein